MKGITHFLTGVATASCFPPAIQTAFADKSFLMLYGGFCGILPDTLDFKFARYFWKHDHEVSLTEDNLDAKLAAETVAKAIDEAAETGKPVRVKLNVIRISTNYYRTIAVQIDGERKEVTAYVGPLKTMSHVMARGETLPSDAARFRAIAEKGSVAVLRDIAQKSASLPGTIPEPEIAHVAKFKADIHNTYYADTEIGIFSGPDWQFAKQADGRVRVDFIPWHRHWSHSVTLGLLLGPLGLLLFGLSGLLAGQGFLNTYSLAALFIGPLAFWSHVFVDQLGYLGSNLFPPWTKWRSVGFKWSTSSSAFGNQMVNYLSAAIILWNINAYGPKPVFTLPWARGIAGDFSNVAYYLVSLLNYAVVAVALPLLVAYAIVRLHRKLYYAKRQINYGEEDEGIEDFGGGGGDL